SGGGEQGGGNGGPPGAGALPRNPRERTAPPRPEPVGNRRNAAARNRAPVGPGHVGPSGGGEGRPRTPGVVGRAQGARGAADLQGRRVGSSPGGFAHGGGPRRAGSPGAAEDGRGGGGPLGPDPGPG